MEYLGTKVGPGLGLGKVLIIENVTLDNYPDNLTGSTSEEKEKLQAAADKIKEHLKQLKK